MPITIDVNQNQINKTDKLTLHYLPAKVDGEGSVNVDQYFNNYTRTENGILFNALRGYPLNGNELTVPEGYKGVVIQEPPNLEGVEDDRKLRVTGAFDQFTYWNYDKIPSKADSYVQALQWTNLAKQLSTSIEEDEVLAEIKAHKQEIESKENQQ